MKAGSRTCVAVHKVSKKFSRSLKRSFVYGAKDVARAVIGMPPSDRLRPSEFWALNDVSFELEPGRSLGIIGVNGSGKTTLLRIVSGVLKPTTGSVEVHGRIAPMLALGAGFQPVLSGRENVFLNLSILGVSQRDIRKRFDSVVDFAELHDAIDAPVGTYSSGMRARLGFACAVHTNPSILVVDEVLSVGDARFRVKCRNHINELRRQGTSLLLVSHSAVLIEALCDDCLYLQNGKMVAYGKPKPVLIQYEEDSIKRAGAHNEKTVEIFTQQAVREGAALNGLAILSLLFLSGERDNGFWVIGQEGTIEMRIRSATSMVGISFNLMIFDLTQPGAEAVQWITSLRDIGLIDLPEGETTVQLKFPHVGLPAGMYRVKLSVSAGKMSDILDVLDDLRLVVRDIGLGNNCAFFQPREWTVNGDPCNFLEISEEDVEMEVMGEG